MPYQCEILFTKNMGKVIFTGAESRDKKSMEQCPNPAVECVLVNEGHTWMCAGHFDEFLANWNVKLIDSEWRLCLSDAEEFE